MFAHEALGNAKIFQERLVALATEDPTPTAHVESQRCTS